MFFWLWQLFYFDTWIESDTKSETFIFSNHNATAQFGTLHGSPYSRAAHCMLVINNSVGVIGSEATMGASNAEQMW